jgi:glycosyltransferase involved in cell wall biosynthesis
LNESLTARPLVSVIVPSFNQGKFIRETIDSILAQDYRPLEVLVCDGGSQDETLSVLESYQGVAELRWRSEPDKGVADAVNKGMSKVRGQIVAIQSSDDLYLPGAISAAVEYLIAHDDVALVYGDVELINEHSECIGRDVLTAFDLKHYLGRFTYIPQPCAFFRAAMIEEIGGWRHEVSYVADADFWFRIAVRHRVAKMDKLMARYRYHPEQRDTQKARIARDWEKAIDDLMNEADLDRATRRFARMGIYLAKYRYTPESDWLKRTRYLYQAAGANPRALLDDNFPKRELLVGREPIWKFLSRIKRGLRLPARRDAHR